MDNNLEENGQVINKKYIRKFNKKTKKVLIISAIILIAISLLYVLFVLIFVPKLTLNGDNYVTLDVFSDYKESGYKASYWDKDLTDYVWIDSSTLNTKKIGTYTIKYHVRKNKMTTTKVRKINVVDRISPEIELKGEPQVKICPNKKYAEIGYSAKDNYDGDLTDKVTRTEDNGKITYTVVDSSGNKTEKIRVTNYLDDEKPAITLTGGNTIYVTLGANYVDSGYKAIDNCDGDITSKVIVTGEVKTDKLGTYKRTYTVIDSNNNETVVERTIIVKNKSTNTTCVGKSGVIYLTFDDGPNSINTTKILDVLKKYNVKATFFVTMAGPDSLIVREHKEGHTVGLHTATHNYKTVYSSVNGYYKDLNTISARVKRLTGIDSKIIRFPGGSSNTISRNYQKAIMSTLTKDVLNKGYSYFDWNISSGDAGGAKNSDEVYKNVVNSLSKSCSNVVLMHDIKQKTADAIERIIKYGLEHGYTFEKIDNNTAMVWHRVNN